MLRLACKRNEASQHQQQQTPQLLEHLQQPRQLSATFTPRPFAAHQRQVPPKDYHNQLPNDTKSPAAIDVGLPIVGNEDSENDEGSASDEFEQNEDDKSEEGCDDDDQNN